MTKPVIFISYSHDSTAHKEKVLALAERLRQDGLDARLDQYVNGTPKQKWPRWMLDQLDEASFVLIVCTEVYYRRFRGHEESGRGKGVDWEGALITQEIYDSNSRTTKFVPVMLAAGQEPFIPQPLRGYTHYELTSQERYEALYAFLLGQGGTEPLQLGEIKNISKVRIEPLEFQPTRSTRPTVIDVPHRNRFFTGRENLLTQLHQQLQTRGISALAQAAIYGLGGIGKTQIAIEYAHRFSDNYGFILWVSAESEPALRASYLSIARALRLNRAQVDLETSVKAVKEWLSREAGWLLIFDNAEDISLLRKYLPSARMGGAVLLTSRAKSFAYIGIGEPLRVDTMDSDEAITFLLARTKCDDAGTAAELSEKLDCLPLALEQAAAYIDTIGVSFSAYLASFERRGLQLLEKGKSGEGYPFTVATTWNISFSNVKEISPASAELLTATAFLAPDFIPIQVFIHGCSALGSPLAEGLKTADEDPLIFWELLEPLERYSLVERLSDDAFKLHRLTQEVIKDSLEQECRQSWAERVLKALNIAYQRYEPEPWKLPEGLQPSARVAVDLVRTYKLDLPEAIQLFNAAGYVSLKRGDYEEARLFAELSVEIHRRATGDGHPDSWLYKSNLAETLRAVGDLNGAKDLQIQVLNFCEETLGSEHPFTSMSRNNLAGTLGALGYLYAARELHEQNLEIRERNLGSEDPSTIVSKASLAEILRDLGELADARLLQEQILEIQERKLGIEHPETLILRNNLAETLRRLKYLEEAREIHKQTLEARERIFGRGHPDTCCSRNNLALTLRQIGDLIGARKLYTENLEIRERTMGDRHPDTLASRNNLAEALRVFGDLAGARKLQEQTLEIRESVLGSEHPDTTRSMWNLLRTVRDLGDYKSELLLVRKLTWLLKKNVLSISSAEQRTIRQYLIDFLNPS